MDAPGDAPAQRARGPRPRGCVEAGRGRDVGPVPVRAALRVRRRAAVPGPRAAGPGRGPAATAGARAGGPVPLIPRPSANSTAVGGEGFCEGDCA